jgi:hypothetical protein
MPILPGPGSPGYGLDRRLYRLEVLVWNLISRLDASSLDAENQELFETLRTELWKQLGGREL